jgi:hypothetical protein
MSEFGRLGRQYTLAAMVSGLALLSACSGGSDGAGDEPLSDLLPDVTHFLEPTEQMRDAAEQQCLDDPDLAEGYVRAVSPDTDEVMAELSVDCPEVRAG